jgi:Domain of unknown function (DUF4389)
MSAYYAAGGPAQAPATGQSAPAPVQVSFAGPAPQSRVTVLFRLLMAIPQLIVLWVLGIAAFVVTVIGWFGALFTGRLPVFAADFLTGYLRWPARVTALDRNLAASLNTFAGQLRTISMPSKATAANARLITAVSNTAAIFARLGAATSISQYNSIGQSSGLQPAANQVDTAYNDLASALTS